jgi:hypothetical protein
MAWITCVRFLSCVLLFCCCRESLNDITNIMGVLFICITFLGTSNASGVQPIVAAERPVFYREVASGMYSQLPFAVAQVRGLAGPQQRTRCGLF